MTKDFLINKLKELSAQFPHLSIKYMFDYSAKYHIVTIEPTIDDNEDLVNATNDLYDALEKECPNEDFLICEPKECLKDKYIIWTSQQS